MKLTRKQEWIISCFGLFWWVEHNSHKYMTNRDIDVELLRKSTYSYIKEKLIIQSPLTYKEFIEMDYFKYPSSFFNLDRDVYIHAGIVRIGNIGHIMTPYGYFKLIRLIRRLNKKHYSKPYIND